jgi:hypothetical protein
MPDLNPQCRTAEPRRSSGLSRRLSGVLLVSCQACARFGYELPEWNLETPGAGGGRTTRDAGGPSMGGASSGGASGASVGGVPEAGVDDAGSSGAGGSGGASGAPDAGTCFDGVRSLAESGADCGGPSCAPCRCTLGEPQRLGAPNYPGNDLWSPSLSRDGLTLFFAVTVPGVSEQIAVATRDALGAPFGSGQALPAPINQGTEGTPFLAPSGRSLYFFSERAGGAGGRDLYVATRASTSDVFGSVGALSNLNTPDREHLPWISADELTLYFVSNRGGVADIYRATRSTTSGSFSTPGGVTELNSDSEDGGITLSFDGLQAILASNRPGGVGGRDLYFTTRASTTAPFSTPTPVPELNTGNNEFDPRLSPDGRELFFASNRDGGDTVLYRSTRSCSP